jgi:hypothetical protein
LAIASADTVACHLLRGNTRGKSALPHLTCQDRLGGKVHTVGKARLLTALLVCPVLRQYSSRLSKVQSSSLA